MRGGQGRGREGRGERGEVIERGVWEGEGVGTMEIWMVR